MKAIKINKIQWDLDNLTPEEKTKAMKTLPTVKGFMASDDFMVADKVPGLLKKHYGYDVITFSFVENRVAENIDDLLLICAPKSETVKGLHRVGSNKLSAYGERCLANLISNIRWRLSLEEDGTPEYDMPVILDEVMLGMEKITGMKWDEGHTLQEWMKPVKKMLSKKDMVIGEVEDEEEDED